MRRQLPAPTPAGSSNRPRFGQARNAGRCAAQDTPSLSERQRIFAAALLDPALPVPDGLVGPDALPGTKRFGVYRNNVVVGLIESLRAAFPVVCRLVGDEFFTAMARAYVVFEPPSTPVMLAYGATFPDFVATFEPALSVPYLPDVARLERAWGEAYHAAEATPFDPARLGPIDPARLLLVRFTLHPSLRIVRSAWPIVEIWSMNIDGGMPAAVDIGRGGEHALIMRPAAEVEVRAVSAGAAAWMLGLQAGASVIDATARAIDEEPGFDLARALCDLSAIDAIVGWSASEETAPMP
ncbi:Putative DNA-binding domain-containing protein [Paraburkholderia lycopersici]|uniref:Putative DNA-binding domain-containing protein n=2 Tax=Paraburkholderia lycopersici TaxID=416944 RepID=A0A1G6Q4W2_9BURK|nr:Putative DNA-binding domain-containing protein [Paraburkholderia lycopersici]